MTYDPFGSPIDPHDAPQYYQPPPPTAPPALEQTAPYAPPAPAYAASGGYQQQHPGIYPPGYPPAPYPPAGYQQQYPPPGYPAGYAPYPGGYPITRIKARPGIVTASAVLAYIEAGLLIIAAIGLFAGASTLDNFANDFDSGTDGVTARFVLLGIANLVCAVLFLTGGLKAAGRQGVGRTLLFIGAAAVGIIGIIWLTWIGSIVIFYTMIFWVLAALAGSFLGGRRISDWLAGRPSPPGPGQYPGY